MHEVVGRPLPVLVVLMASLVVLQGCDTTQALTSGLAPPGGGFGPTEVDAAMAAPIEPGIENVTLWPSPAGLYGAARQAPAAVLTTAYDAPMAFTSEMAHLLSFAWGGEDRVAEATYGTWRELRELDPINPIPPLPSAEAPTGAEPTRPTSGWTITDG